MGVRSDEFTIEHDIELNRGLCSYLLKRLNEALEYADVLSEDALLPGWVERLFGRREGLVGAYIRLSQQQLRIAAAMADAQKWSTPGEGDVSITNEDIILVRAALKRWEEHEGQKEY